MANKRKQKRRLKKEFIRRGKEIDRMYDTKTARAFRNIFVKSGVLD